MRSITNTHTTIPFLGGSPRKFEITMNRNGKQGRKFEFGGSSSRMDIFSL